MFNRFQKRTTGVEHQIRQPRLPVVLDKYTIIEPGRTRTVYNWLQTFGMKVDDDRAADLGQMDRQARRLAGDAARRLARRVLRIAIAHQRELAEPLPGGDFAGRPAGGRAEVQLVPQERFLNRG